MTALRTPATSVHEVPVVAATHSSFARYGRIVRDFEAEEVFLETWPAGGWRPIVSGTGAGGGVTRGDFVMYRDGDALIAHNHAVDGHYVTGWFDGPDRLLVREANYHPDGGQVFYPRDGVAFVALLAPPGDDVSPRDFVAFYCDGSFGIQIRPGVWHQPVFPIFPSAGGKAVFDDKQGRVHACVAVDFVDEHDTYLAVPLSPPLD